MGGTLILPATPEIIASFVALAQSAPEELSTIANVMLAPPVRWLPATAHGKLVIMAKLVYAGDVEDGERAIAPFRALAKPLGDMVTPKLYPEIYPPEEDRHPVASMHSIFIDSVDRSVAQAIVEHLETSTAKMAAAEIRVLGGAMARVSADATAFAHRGSYIMVNVAATYDRPDEATTHEPWVDDFAAALRQSDSGVYVGFLGDESEARVRDAYPGITREKLVAVKSRYDPANLFRLNQNIPPRGQASPRAAATPRLAALILPKLLSGVNG